MQCSYLYGRAGDDALCRNPFVGEDHITADLQVRLAGAGLSPCTPLHQVVEAATKGNLQGQQGVGV